MQKKYLKALRKAFFYELATMAHDVICFKLYGENILVPFFQSNTFYKMKSVVVMGKKIDRISRSMRHWNYPNLSLLSDTNINNMGVASSLS